MVVDMSVCLCEWTVGFFFSPFREQLEETDWEQSNAGLGLCRDLVWLRG